MHTKLKNNIESLNSQNPKESYASDSVLKTSAIWPYIKIKL